MCLCVSVCECLSGCVVCVQERKRECICVSVCPYVCVYLGVWVSVQETKRECVSVCPYVRVYI